MKHVFACALVLGFWTIAAAQTAYKPVATEQQAGTSQAEQSYPMAGSPKLDADWEAMRPVLEAYAQSHPQQLQKSTAWNFTVGQKYTWWATNQATSTLFEYQVPSTCKAVGINCYIFVEDSLWNNGRVNQSAVDAMKSAFDFRTPADSTKGIYQLDTQYFGNPPDVDRDPRIIILILDIKDGYSDWGSYVAGYFMPLNEYPEAAAQQAGSNRHSNQAEIYYVDGNPVDLRTTSGVTNASSTTAHEFQHMIHWNYDQYEITFVNEGLACSASALCGYNLKSPSLYYANTNLSFLSWNSTGDYLTDYSRAALFTWYLIEQFGSGVAKQILQSTATGIAGYNDAFSKKGSSLTFNDMLKSFAVANVLNDKTVDPRYGFALPITSTITPLRTYYDPKVLLQSQSIEAQGTVYLLYKGGKNLTATFTSQSSTIVVKAIATGSGGKKVTDIPLYSQYFEPGFGTSYDQVIFAATNLGSSPASFSYSSNGQAPALAVQEFAYEDGVPEGFLFLAAPDTAVVWFDAAPGAVLDSIRVAFWKDGSIGFGIWKYTGAQRPTPLGSRYGFTTLNVTGSPTYSFPYPVPYPNWRTIDVSSWNVDLSIPFAVGFVFGRDSTAPGLMTSIEPYMLPHHSYTNFASSSVRDWYVCSTQNAGDSAYKYVVRAYAHTGAATAPSTPFLISPSHQSIGVSTSPTLMWHASSGASSYHLQVSTSLSFATLVEDDLTIADTMKVTGPLQNNTLYYWRVSAANTVRSSLYSSVASFTTTLASPVLITPEDSAEVLSSKPHLEWAPSAQAKTYRLQLSTSPTFGTTIVDDSTVMYLSIARWVGPVTSSTTYYWRVSASAPGTTSAFSAGRSLRTIVKPFNGDQWILQTSGVNVMLYCVKAVSQTIAWTAGDSGRVLRTTNGGSTWMSVGGGPIGSAPISAIEALDANVALVTASPGGGGSGTFIYRTTNGGASWLQVYSDPTPTAFIDAIKMYDAKNGIALGDPVGGKWVILKTVNGGTAWNRIPTEPNQIGNEAGLNNLFCAVGSTNIWFGSTQGGRVYRSSDAGSTWAMSVLPAAVPGYVQELWFGNQQSGVATTAGSTFRSTDGGATWMPISHGGNEDGLAIGGAGTSDVWMQKDASIVRSTDGGASWSLSLSDTNNWLLLGIHDLSFVSDGTSVSGWSVGLDGVIFSFVGSLTNIIVAPQAPTLAAPADSAINLQLNTILSWNTAPDAMLYHLQVSTAPTFTSLSVDDSTLSTTSRSVGPLSLATNYYWRVRAKNQVGWGPYSFVRRFSTIRTTSVEQEGSAIPTEYALRQNYPNPFNPATTIQFALPKSGYVTLKVFDALGKEVTTLVAQEVGAGYFSVKWNTNVPSGVYFYRLQSGEFVETKKMMVVK